MLLAIDTSKKIGSLSIANDSEIIFQQSFKNINSHSQYLPLIVNNSLKLFNKSINNINKIVICDGPGSFTGLRISFAYAQGLCFAQNIIKYKATSLLLPLIFIETNFPDIKKFYSIITIKKDFSIIALVDVNKKMIIDKPFHFQKNIDKINQSIPIISDTDTTFLQNAKIEFYNNNIVLASYLAELVLKDYIKEENSENIFSPTYFKLSDADENLQ